MNHEGDERDKQNHDMNDNHEVSKKIYTRLAMRDVIIRISRIMISRVIMVEGS